MEENKEKLKETAEQPVAEEKPEKKKKKKKAGPLYYIIMVLLIAIFAFSAYNVIKIGLKYYHNQKTYKEVQQAASPKGFDGNIDFAALSKINPDIKAWIYLKDTKIDYPIVQGPDNDKYLNTKFNGEWGTCGTLFADYTTESAFNQFLTIVYGHHMKDGTMFNSLKDFKDEEYLKNHKRFELITPECKYHLDVVAFFNQPADSNLYQPNFYSEQQKLNYIDLVNNLAMYRTNEAIAPEDKLVLLSTCAYEYEGARYMVLGKLKPWKNQNATKKSTKKK